MDQLQTTKSMKIYTPQKFLHLRYVSVEMSMTYISLNAYYNQIWVNFAIDLLT